MDQRNTATPTVEGSPTKGYQRGLLALFIQDPDLMYKSPVRPEHFDGELRAIFEALLKLDAEGVAITPAEIHNSCDPKVQKTLQMLSSGTGIDWIRTALFKPPATANFDRYVKGVMSHAKHQSLIVTAETVVARLRAAEPFTAPDKLAEEALATMEGAYSTVVSGGTNEVVVSDETYDELEREATALYEASKVRARLSFGHAQFDNLVHGMPYGRFVLWLGDKKAGKSLSLMNLALTAGIGRYLTEEENDWLILNKFPEPVLILDNEMDYRMDWKPRMLSWLSGVPVDLIRNGAWTQDEATKSRVRRANELLRTSKVIFEKVPPGDVKAAKAAVRKAKAKYGCQRAFYDYIKRPASAENTYIEMGNFARLMNEEIAKELDISLVAAAQTRDDGRVAGSIDLVRECDLCIHLSKISTSMRKLTIPLSRFTRELEETEYFEVPCDFRISRMSIGRLRNDGD